MQTKLLHRNARVSPRENSKRKTFSSAPGDVTISHTPQRLSLQNFPRQSTEMSLKLNPCMPQSTAGHTVLHLLKFWMVAQIESPCNDVSSQVNGSNHLCTHSLPAPILRWVNTALRTQLSDLGINFRQDSPRLTYLTSTSTTFWQVFTAFNRL